MVGWNGENYFLTLANLWANLVSCTPPNMPHIHVGWGGGWKDKLEMLNGSCWWTPIVSCMTWFLGHKPQMHRHKDAARGRIEDLNGASYKLNLIVRYHTNVFKTSSVAIHYIEGSSLAIGPRVVLLCYLAVKWVNHTTSIYLEVGFWHVYACIQVFFSL